MKIFLFLLLITAVSCNSNQSETKTDIHAAHKSSSGAGGYADSVNSGLISPDTLKGSPHRIAMAVVNGNHVHLEYNSPGVKGRNIWGGLVAWDQVWAAGAHSATWVQFDKAVEIDGKEVAAGKYALFLIPRQGKWIFILNSRHTQHLADEYNMAEDVLRLELEPEEHAMTERLTYRVEATNDGNGQIVFLWEKVKVVCTFEA